MPYSFANLFTRKRILSERRRPIRRYRLSMESLETRFAPAVQSFAGLDFTAAAFTVNGSQVSANSPVSVAVHGETTQLLDFSGGVTFQSNDPTGSFTPLGTVSAIVPNASDIPLLNGGPHATISAAALLPGGAGASSMLVPRNPATLRAERGRSKKSRAKTPSRLCARLFGASSRFLQESFLLPPLDFSPYLLLQARQTAHPGPSIPQET